MALDTEFQPFNKELALVSTHDQLVSLEAFKANPWFKELFAYLKDDQSTLLEAATSFDVLRQTNGHFIQQQYLGQSTAVLRVFDRVDEITATLRNTLQKNEHASELPANPTSHSPGDYASSDGFLVADTGFGVKSNPVESELGSPFDP